MEPLREHLRVLIDPERLAERVAQLGARLTDDYRGRQLYVIGVLNGSFVFLADLIRQLNLDVIVDFLRISSYGQATESSGVVEFRKDVEIPVTDRDVLVVEDIVDTGLTLDFLLKRLRDGRPRSLRVCALLDKPSRRKTPVRADYVGFSIDDVFVVGYGLDAADRHRHRPAICVVEHEPGTTPIRVVEGADSLDGSAFGRDDSFSRPTP